MLYGCGPEPTLWRLHTASIFCVFRSAPRVRHIVVGGAGFQAGQDAECTPAQITEIALRTPAGMLERALFEQGVAARQQHAARSRSDEALVSASLMPTPMAPMTPALRSSSSAPKPGHHCLQRWSRMARSLMVQKSTSWTSTMSMRARPVSGASASERMTPS